MAATQRPATQEALVEPSGDHPLWKGVPSWFLIGEEDRIIPPELQRFMADRAGSQRTVAIAGASHAITVSRPDAVVELVLEAARATSGVALARWRGAARGRSARARPSGARRARPSPDSSS